MSNDTKFCQECGAKINIKAEICPECGVRQGNSHSSKISNKNTQDFDRTTAGILALFLGGIGVHKFYLGQTGQGLIYLLLCWTFIPGIIALVEAINYLAMSDQKFQENYS